MAMGYSQPPGVWKHRPGETFPTAALIPQDLFAASRRCTLFILPLITRDALQGFFVCECGTRVDVVYGMMREQISNAIGICDMIANLEAAEGRLTQTLTELQKSEERYREMAFLLPAIILETDLALDVRYMNQAGLSLFRQSAADGYEGLNLLELVHPEDRARFKEKIPGLSFGDLPDLNDIRIVRHDGQEVTLLSRVSFSRRGGRIEGIRWSAIDLKPLLTSVVKPDREFFERYRFSPREQEIIELLLQGHKIREAAGKLFISEKTVKSHITSIYSRMDVTSRSEFFDVVKNYLSVRYGPASFKISLLNQLLRSGTACD